MTVCMRITEKNCSLGMENCVRVEDEALVNVERQVLLGVGASSPEERGPVEEAIGARRAGGDLIVGEVDAHLAFALVGRRSAEERCGELLDDVAYEQRLGHRSEASAGANEGGADNDHRIESKACPLARVNTSQYSYCTV